MQESTLSNGDNIALNTQIGSGQLSICEMVSSERRNTLRVLYLLLRS